MTLSDFKQVAVPTFDSFWETLVAKEKDYFTKHGKYFQLIISPSSKVSNGVATPFEVNFNLEEKFSTDIDFSFTSKIPFQIEVWENFGGDQPVGFMAVATAEVDGVTYTRRKHSSDGKDEDWTPIPLEP